MKEKTIKIIDQAPVGIITFSANGDIEYINQNIRKLGILYHIKPAISSGDNILSVNLFPDANLQREIEQVLEGMPFERELSKITTGNGNQVSLVVKGTPIYENDKITGGMLLIEDIKVLTETKEQLELQTDYIEKAIYIANDALMVTNVKADVKFAAGSALKNLNLVNKEVVGKNLIGLFEGDVRSVISKRIKEVVKNEKPVKFTFDVGNSKKHFSFECKIEPVMSKRGTLHLLFFFFNNITSEVEEKSRLTKKVDELTYYKSIVNNLNDAVFALDKDGKIIFWDDQSEKLFDMKRSEVMGEFFGSKLELFDKRFFESIKKDLKKEKVWKVNLNIFGNDQQKEILEAKFSYANNSEDEIVVICSRITKRVKEEEELKFAKEEFKRLVEHTQEMVCKINNEGNITFANQTMLDKLKYTEEEITGRNIKTLIFNEYFEHTIFDVKAFDKNKPTELELPVVSKPGKQILTNAVFVPDKTKSGNINFMCYFTEVPEEEPADEKEFLYPSLFKSSLDGIAVETEGKIILANDSFAKIFGYDSGEELIDKDILDLVSNDDILKVAEYFRLKEHGKNAPDRFEFLGKKKDNTYFYTELSISTFEVNKKNFIVMVIRDITERKRAQKVIRESEEKYRNITENIDDFLYTFERSGKYMRPLFYTAAVEKITGYSQADFLGDSKLFLKIVHPDDFATVKKKLSNLMKSQIQNSAEMEFRIIHKQGNIVWVKNKVNVIRNASGRIQKVYGLVSDITLSKRAEEELKKSTESLIKLNETKDRFLSIISHDLRTPFSSILGFTDLLANDEDLTPEERKQYVKYIQDSSKSMLSLVNSLLDWTRLQTGRIKFEPERIDAVKIIEKSINALKGAAMQKGVEIYSTVKSGNYIFVDQNLLTQVFNNLLSNAIKFSSAGDKVILSVRPAASLRFLEFAVKDTGRGIKAADLDKLFKVDTKFTTEGTAGEKGSGLGLSLVKEIIEKHGGIIWAESEYGRGATFKFTLPVASATILIVDENKTDRVLYSKILKNITPDYTVEVASNGNEALEKIKLSPPALLITEHDMPEMDGYTLVQELVKAGLLGKPPVIVLSSNIDRATIQEYNDLGVEYVFQKPVNLRSFKQAVEKSLRKSLTGNGH